MFHPATPQPSPESEIQSLLERFEAAIGRKDAKAAIDCLSDDVVAYDLAPPLKLEGEAARDPAGLQEWFDIWDGPIASVARDLRLRVGDNVAYGHGLRRMTGAKKDGESVDVWFRATVGLVKGAGGWRISHLHNSVPFAMDGSGKALLDLKPLD